MITCLKNITAIICFMVFTINQAQTSGFNYQALILNTEEIQIPGTIVKENQLPLSLEKVTFRFTIANENGAEYTEEQTITTDERGMVSLIVGEGTPITASFKDIIWDGKLKYLIVEVNILSSSEGFQPLDSQKILYLPNPTNGTAKVLIVNGLSDLNTPYSKGNLIWVKSFGLEENPTLMIFDGVTWLPVSDDIKPTNELGLLVATNDADRATLFDPALVGDQIWNQNCGCIQVFDGTNWISINSTESYAISNGLTKINENIKLGGTLIEPTKITTDAINTLTLEGLEESTFLNDKLVVIDSKSILKIKSPSSLLTQKQIIVTAVDNQLRFVTPFPITTKGKIDVYRNGIRIAFTIINTLTVELEAEAKCFAGDEIRIVQIH